DNFDVGEVGENFRNRPLLRGGALAQFRGGDAFHEAVESLRRGRLHLKRVLILSVGEDALGVLLHGFVHGGVSGALQTILVLRRAKDGTSSGQPAECERYNSPSLCDPGTIASHFGKTEHVPESEKLTKHQAKGH